MNEELKFLKSIVDNGKETKDTPSGNPGSKGKETNKESPKKENSTSDTDDDDFMDDNEDLPAPKVNCNSSCNLNPCCLTYSPQHTPTY